MAWDLIHAQARENSTNAVSVYSPGSGESVTIKNVVVVNQSGADADLSIYLDHDGTTYDESTALVWQQTLISKETFNWDCFMTMDDANGNFAYKSSVANALTITIGGVKES